MGRSESRDSTFKLVFEYTINKEKNETTLNEFLSDTNIEKDYVVTVYNGVIEHYQELCEDVKNFAKGFSLDRIYKVDLSLMLIALYEIKYMQDIPNVVSINEAVNLAKIYSTDKSYGYINGILSNFVNNE